MRYEKYSNSQSQQTQDCKPNTRKSDLIPKKPNKKIPKNSINYFEDFITGEGFKILESQMNCYFQ